MSKYLEEHFEKMKSEGRCPFDTFSDYLEYLGSSKFSCDHEIVIIDPKKEYRQLVKSLGGKER